MKSLLVSLAFLALLISAEAEDADAKALRARLQATPTTARVTLSNDQWRKLLTPAQYQVLREGATEPAFANQYASNHERGVYSCAACGRELFDAETKFDSGTGWPSFYAPLASNRISLAVDTSNSARRDEVRCARCSSHLGHVFKDGPPPTHLRYCLNSLALKLNRSR